MIFQINTENELLEEMRKRTYPSESNKMICIQLYERMLKKVLISSLDVTS